jgi:hypothetical protein
VQDMRPSHHDDVTFVLNKNVIVRVDIHTAKQNT